MLIECYNTIMIYIHTALKAEALPLIEHFNLTLQTQEPFRIYTNDNIFLVIGLKGYDNTLMATTALLSHYSPKDNAYFLNVGLCGAPHTYDIGTLVEVNSLIYEDAYSFHLTPRTDLNQSALETLNEAGDVKKEHMVDMEAYAAFKAASLFIKRENITVLKVVSDHFEPYTLSKNLATTLIHKNVSKISKLIKEIRCQQL